METTRTLKSQRRWRWRQRTKNTVLYALMRGGHALARALPLRGLLRLLGCMAPYLFRREAKRARAQLSLALPQLDATKTTRRMFVHFAQSIWELSRLHREVPILDGAARRVLDDALAAGRGAVVISGHIGNWELLGHAIAAAGYPITTLAKPSYDPRVTQWLQKWRALHGLKIIWRDKSNAGKMILSALRHNSLIAFLIDQDIKAAGDFVPFFGRPAFTPTTPAALALRTGAPVIVCWHQRRHKLHAIAVERIDYVPTGNAAHDALALTATITERLESIIRAAPEQWVWLHKRWRKFPAG